MATIDPLGSLRLVMGQRAQTEYDLIDVLLDDSPTSIVSDVVKIPGGRFSIGLIITLAATASPTSAELRPEISWDGTNFYTLRSGGIQDELVLLAAMPYSSYVEEEIHAPFFRMTVVGNGTNSTDKITVHVGLMPAE